MDTNNKASTGNEKTPINSSNNGTDNNAGNVEKYGGPGDNKNYDATLTAGDDLTVAQEK
jgi:hypothetical protein